MIFLELFIAFLKVGLFSFGGAYGAIPLIREVVLSYGWITDEELTYMIAVSESTPGPIMVNVATYVGSSVAGFFGAFLATFAVVLPAFAVIVAASMALKSVIDNKYVQASLKWVKFSVAGIVFATGIHMVLKSCLGAIDEISFDVKAIIIAAILLAAGLIYKVISKKKIPPITTIVISAVLGVVVYGF